MAQTDAARELGEWWREQAEAEIEMVVAKAIEYGARDLIEMGRSLAYMAGREGLTDAQLAEWGCVQYMIGKMARIEAAWAEGRMPSDDSYLDVGIYVRMIQRIRQVGGWPGSTPALVLDLGPKPMPGLIQGAVTTTGGSLVIGGTQVGGAPR